MADLSAFPNRLDRKKRQCCAIIETPKNRRNKFDYDPESDLFRLGGLLPEGMMFPFDFGFIVGCLLDVRIIGVIEATQTEDGKTETNDRLLGVAIHSYQHQDVSSIEELNPALLDQVEQFFVSYNKLRGKKFKLKSQGGPKRAVAIVEKGIQAFKKKKKQ
jgi:inorganic pyrophosphatase